MVTPRDLLCNGQIEVEGRMPWSSNGTFLVSVSLGDESTKAIYKPHKGERPLWDFPDGLYRREVAAYELSEALGWDLVPVTVLRDGPMGDGSLQWFVDADFSEHYFTLQERPALRHQFQAMCAFDLIANNTDRKSGHCLLADDEQIYGIDHGLAFHHEFKLRTVIWEFGGEAVPQDLLDDIERFLTEGPPTALSELLDSFENDAMKARARALLDNRKFPIDASGHRYPWPLV